MFSDGENTWHPESICKWGKGDFLIYGPCLHTATGLQITNRRSEVRGQFKRCPTSKTIICIGLYVYSALFLSGKQRILDLQTMKEYQTWENISDQTMHRPCRFSPLDIMLLTAAERERIIDIQVYLCSVWYYFFDTLPICEDSFLYTVIWIEIVLTLFFVFGNGIFQQLSSIPLSICPYIYIIQFFVDGYLRLILIFSCPIKVILLFLSRWKRLGFAQRFRRCQQHCRYFWCCWNCWSYCSNSVSYIL